MFPTDFKPATSRSSKPLGAFAPPSHIVPAVAAVGSALDLRPLSLIDRSSSVPAVGPWVSDLEVRARTAGVTIRTLGVGTLPSRPLLGTFEEAPWVVCALEDDPLFKSGKFPIPRPQRRDLQRLVRGGVTMDEVFVAHELDPSTVDEAVGLPDPETIVEVPVGKLDRLVEHPGPSRATRHFTDISGGIARVVGTSAKAARRGITAGATAIAATPGVLLDPIIFGARLVPGRPETAAVFELVRWTW